MDESVGGNRDTDESGRPTVNILMNNAIGKAMRNGKDILVRNSFSLDSDTIDNRWVVKTIRTIAAHVKSPKAANEGLKALADVVEAMTKQRLVDDITEMVTKDVRETVGEMRTLARRAADTERRTAEMLAGIQDMAEVMKTVKQDLSNAINTPARHMQTQPEETQHQPGWRRHEIHGGKEVEGRDVMLLLSSTEARNWLNGTEITKAFLAGFNGGRPREGSIKNAAWIRPVERCAQSQQYAHMKIKFESRSQANKAIRDGYSLGQGDNSEEGCAGATNMLQVHTIATDTSPQLHGGDARRLRHCGQEHRSAQCPHPSRKWCWNCKRPGHGAGDRSCGVRQKRLEHGEGRTQKRCTDSSLMMRIRDMGRTWSGGRGMGPHGAMAIEGCWEGEQPAAGQRDFGKGVNQGDATSKAYDALT
ncbi:hypothetical protein IMY05_C4855000100 [Salix suchowensis]|nr:hypothetical protein IMY05_C4855000100 [Salix suchowensis]